MPFAVSWPLTCMFLSLELQCMCFTGVAHIHPKIIEMHKGICDNLLQSSAVITRSNVVRYCINNCRNWSRISSGYWIYQRHHIPHPNGRAMGCLFSIIFRKLTRYNGTTLYVSSHWHQVWVTFQLFFKSFSIVMQPPPEDMAALLWRDTSHYKKNLTLMHWGWNKVSSIVQTFLNAFSNSSPPGQNGCLIADDIFRCIFVN